MCGGVRWGCDVVLSKVEVYLNLFFSFAVRHRDVLQITVTHCDSFLMSDIWCVFLNKLKTEFSLAISIVSHNVVHVPVWVDHVYSYIYIPG